MTGILDEYPGASAAYSLRLLNTDYTGDAVIVRRASDNATQNVGFVDGELDTTALDTFCSGTDGFVATWFDQSGNGVNTTQSVASKQPKIYDSVTGVILENGKPSIYFDGVDDGLEFTNAISYSNTYTFSVINPLIDDIYSFFTDGSAVAPIAASGSTSSYTFAYGINSIYINSNILTGSTRDDFYNATTNNQTLTTVDLDSSVNSITSVFNRVSFAMNGVVQELIIYNTDQSTNRTGIETNINNHYSIY